MKVIKGDLVLEKDTVFDEDIKVEGDIVCKNGRWNIDAGGITANNITANNIIAWDIDAWDITANNIIARNITARDITARDIDAWNIDARNIRAWDITCISRKKKTKDAKTIACNIITDKFNREKKEVMPER